MLTCTRTDNTRRCRTFVCSKADPSAEEEADLNWYSFEYNLVNNGKSDETNKLAKEGRAGSQPLKLESLKITQLKN